MLVLGIMFNLALNGLILVLVIRVMLRMPDNLRKSLHDLNNVVHEHGILLSDHAKRITELEKWRRGPDIGRPAP